MPKPFTLFLAVAWLANIGVALEAAEQVEEVRPLVENPMHTVEPGYEVISLSDRLRKAQRVIAAGTMEDFLAHELRPPSAEQQAALRALRRIGTSAIPNLLAKLEWLYSFQEGLAGFEALGPEAVEADSELRHILGTEQHPRNSMALRCSDQQRTLRLLAKTR